ncbi:MAG TPA: SurA N-terminal domain-containing protein [Polyangiaceae bacterium]|nr:SurA N-terminal domain-containing protein [Polyangiaceae bacterium]
MPLRRPLVAAGLALALLLGHVRPAEAVVVERIVAIVGERAILLSELRDRARPYLVAVQQKMPTGAQQAAAESQIFKELIEKMIDEELEAQAASKARVSVSNEEIDNAVQNIAASQNMTVEQLYKSALAASGMTRQEYREELRRQILEGKMVQLRVRGKVRISEEDVRTQFERTVREERRRREYRPAWIVLRIMPGSSPEAVAERKALAADLLARARRGEDFAELARKFSDDPETREKGGDLGIRAPQGSPNAITGKRQVMAPDLEAALLPLEPGQVAGPIQAGDAIAVLKLVDRQASRYTTLEAARGEMLQRLQAEILEKAKRRWLEDLKKRTHIDVRL